MLRPLYILFNMGVVLIIAAVFGGVEIKHSFPNKVNSGSQFTVEFSINKGEIDRYARLTLEIPNGITVTSRETSGGQFSFTDQKAVVHWYSLPYDEVLKVILVFKVAPPISGKFMLSGSFRYIDENKIQEQPIEPHKLEVVQVEGVTDLLASKRYKYKEITLKPIDCIRQKPYMNEDNEIIVNLLVSKSDLSSFGKIEEQIPRGYRAVATRTKGSIFQVSGRIIKFLWMELPKEDTPDNKLFIVTYKLIQTEEFPNQAFIINGNFSYSQDDRTQTISISERNINLNEFAAEQLEIQELTKEEQLAEMEKEKTEKKIDVLADNDNFTGISGLATSENLENLQNQTNKTFEESLTPEEREKYAELAKKAKEQENQIINEESPEILGELKRPEITTTPGAEKGISYKVQIAASHKLVKKNYFKKFNIFETVHIELHDGWHKYTVGNFNVYKEARDHRVKIWNTTTINDAFVCAYSSGNRITVQEALMIANQKWFK